MSNIIDTDVLAFAPELSTVSSGAWTDILTYVNQFTLTSVDDPQDIRMARIFLAAHIAYTTKNAATGVAGPVTSESAGNVRRSYGLIAMNNALLGSTRYGQVYLQIINASMAGGPMVV